MFLTIIKIILFIIQIILFLILIILIIKKNINYNENNNIFN